MRFAPLVLRVKALEPWAFEAFVVLASAWAAKCLALPPSNFGRYPTVYVLVERISRYEEWWALFAGLTAFFGLSGLCLLACRKCRWVMLRFRATALLMAAVFWSIFGISLMSSDWDTIGSGIYLLIAASAFWNLIREPSLPERM